MLILVINSGSSSVKFRLVEVVEGNKGELTTRPPLLHGAVKGIGSAASFEVGGQNVRHATKKLEIRDHTEALRVLLDYLSDSRGEVKAVGHRVVHGGDRYVGPTLITEEVEERIDALSELAPLHNPACLAGIRGAQGGVG